MEKIINTSIMNFLERENLLFAYQFGFCSGLFDADLLTALNREWLTSINSRGAVRVLAVDIAGAFEQVSMPVSFTSCHRMVEGGGESSQVAHRLLFQQNASDRCCATSQPFPVAAGVPQGSILGPTHFPGLRK